MKKTTLHIPDLCCATEQRVIEKQLRGVKNISSIKCDVINKTITVEHEINDEDISNAVKKAGFDSTLLTSSTHIIEDKPIIKSLLFKTTIFSSAIIIFAITTSFFKSTENISSTLFLFGIFVGGWSVAKKHGTL